MANFSRIPSLITPAVLSICLSACGGSDSVVGATTVSIEWLDNSDNEEGFMVERRVAEDVTFATIQLLPKDTVSYVDSSDLLVGSYYCYRVSSFNQAGASSSDEMCIDTHY